MAENVHINMLEVEESKPITSKIILKKPKVRDKEKVETEISKVNVNLRWGSNIYSVRLKS